MTLQHYESKLKAIDPRFSIKRAGWGLVGIYHDGKYILRIASREITISDVVRRETATLKDHEVGLNPLGSYKWERLLERGRYQTALHLYGRKLIKHSDIPKLTY